MHGITMGRITPLFDITSLDHDFYPVVNSRYLAGDASLVNYNLIDLSSLLSSEETQKKSLGSSKRATTNRCQKPCV